MSLKIIEKYTGNQWIPSRMAFLKKGDIVRSKNNDSSNWKVDILDGDAYWSDEFQCYTALVTEYNLTKPFEFSADMTHVIVKDNPPDNK